MENKLKEYIQQRIECLTSPANLQYGFTTVDESYARLCELKGLMDRFGEYELSNDLRRAIRPLREKIEERILTKKK